MTRASFASRLAAPARLVAKRARHFSMNTRRRWKRVAEWPGWRAAREYRPKLSFTIPRPHLALHRLESELHACPACASTSLRVLEPMEMSFPTQGTRVGFATGCRTCGLVFANPMPDQEALNAFYSPDGHWGQDHRQRDELLERRAQRALAGEKKVNQPRRARHIILDALQPFLPIYQPPPDGAALDFGCGDGKLLDGLQEAGWKTYGVEPSSEVAFLRHERVEALPPAPSYDLVVLHHVLEHVPQPLDLLTKLAATLRPGGVMFISVPRLDALPEHGDFRYCINGRTHLVCFSETCLRELFRRAGLEPLAALTSPELDAQLSEGRPLRLRMVARKSGASVPIASKPLAAAIRAFRYSHGRFPKADRSWFVEHLPVRLRAHWMDRDRRPRASKSASAA